MALDAGSALASAPCRCACWCETAGVLFLFLNSFSEHFNTGESIPHGTGPLRSSRCTLSYWRTRARPGVAVPDEGGNLPMRHSGAGVFCENRRSRTRPWRPATRRCVCLCANHLKRKKRTKVGAKGGSISDDLPTESRVARPCRPTMSLRGARTGPCTALSPCFSASRSPSATASSAALHRTPTSTSRRATRRESSRSRSPSSLRAQGAWVALHRARGEHHRRAGRPRRLHPLDPRPHRHLWLDRAFSKENCLEISLGPPRSPPSC